MMEDLGNLAPPRVGEALLLREYAHRTANQIASAIAAMRLTGRSRGPDPLVAQAIHRLEAFGDLHRLLASPAPPLADAGAELEAVCRAVVAARPAASASVVDADLPTTWLDGATSRRLALVAAELVANACRHALEGRRGRLRVRLEIEGEDAVLVVSDDGGGMRRGASSSGTGFGRGIVEELVRGGRGDIAVRTGRRGTRVRVAMPLAARDTGRDDPY